MKDVLGFPNKYKVTSLQKTLGNDHELSKHALKDVLL
jgi:hypothetical protein